MSNKIQRNYPCPCGSGKKFKRCCGHEPTLVRKTQELMEQARQNWLKRQAELASRPRPMSVGVIGSAAPRALLAAALLASSTGGVRNGQP